MKKSSILFLALSGLFFMTSCEKKGENQSASKDTTNQTVAMEEKKGLSDEDKEFMKKAAEDGMLEVELAKYAHKNATSKEVKNFAEMLVMQHEEANKKLKQVAMTKNVTIPDSLSSDSKDKLKKMTEKKGKEFDKDYMKEMVSEHKKDIDKFESSAQKTEDQELKTWIDETLPHLKHHLSSAEKIDSTLSKSSGKMGNKLSMKK